MKSIIPKIKNLVMMTAALWFINTGCVELDEEPKDFTGPTNFYNNVGQIESAFASAMSRLYSEWSGYSYGHWIFASDDQMYSGNLVFSDDQGSDLWDAHYRSIADLNPAIKALNDDRLKNTATQQQKDELMAQAKFIRGFNYFNLVRLFGAVPLITEQTNVVTDEIVRAPIADVYSLIESDLLFAVQNLPDTWSDDTQGRPAKVAAKTLLAKVYITMATAPLNNTSSYAKARDMAADVMDDGTYSLVPDINEVFALENAYGPEIMWSFNASEDDNSTPPQIWLPGSMADGWGDFKADKVWGENYPAQPRKDAYLLLEDWDGKPYTTFDGTTPYVKKYLYDSRENQERYRSVQNIPILRFADALLIFAEAENMVNGGPTQAAVDAVNKIINRANDYVANPNDPLLTTGMTQAAFDAAVIQQRNLEFCFEYDRWHDLVRKRILCEMTIPAYKPNCDENDYLWPIPQTDLRLNPKLTQNPGYATPSGG
ncbi:MAG TPA: RagB/SusD family nutrient uptake outer membrane protein [Chryseosolibacter sp.]|nr:RagB/SusD family nutrient uptake outer membrane protein [Chryseosolibacter sp.]